MNLTPFLEPFDLQRAHLTWMPLAVGEDESLDPSDIGCFRAQAVVFDPHMPANFIQQARS